MGAAGGGDAAAAATDLVLEAGPEVEAAAVAADLPDAGAADPVDLADQRDRGPHQRLGVAVFERPLAELGDDRLLGVGALQVDLGVLALGDVVEDAVPDRDAVGVGFEDRLVEHPHGAPVARAEPVLDRIGVAVADVVLAFDLERLHAVVGVQQPRPEAGVALEFFGGVAEDLLDLGGDVAPAAVLAELGGVDDDRQALDQAPVVLARDLLEEREILVARGPFGVGRLFGSRVRH